MLDPDPYEMSTDPKHRSKHWSVPVRYRTGTQVPYRVTPTTCFYFFPLTNTIAQVWPRSAPTVPPPPPRPPPLSLWRRRGGQQRRQPPIPPPPSCLAGTSSRTASRRTGVRSGQGGRGPAAWDPRIMRKTTMMISQAGY
jgi:hypothetical protein